MEKIKAWYKNALTNKDAEHETVMFTFEDGKKKELQGQLKGHVNKIDQLNDSHNMTKEALEKTIEDLKRAHKKDLDDNQNTIDELTHKIHELTKEIERLKIKITTIEEELEDALARADKPVEAEILRLRR
jgi:chromosome segregation ATPase